MAPKEDVEKTVQSCAKLNPRARSSRPAQRSCSIIRTGYVGSASSWSNKAPSVTHSEPTYGAGTVAAKAVDAVFVDPRARAVGSIRAAYEKYPTLGSVLPALGYSLPQLAELEESINAVECDAVVLGTSADLTKLIKIGKPVARVAFEAYDDGKPTLEELLADRIESFKRAAVASRYRSTAPSSALLCR